MQTGVPTGLLPGGPAKLDAIAASLSRHTKGLPVRAVTEFVGEGPDQKVVGVCSPTEDVVLAEPAVPLPGVGNEAKVASRRGAEGQT